MKMFAVFDGDQTLLKTENEISRMPDFNPETLTRIFELGVGEGLETVSEYNHFILEIDRVSDLSPGEDMYG